MNEKYLLAGPPFWLCLGGRFSLGSAIARCPYKPGYIFILSLRGFVRRLNSISRQTRETTRATRQSALTSYGAAAGGPFCISSFLNLDLGDGEYSGGN